MAVMPGWKMLLATWMVAFAVCLSVADGSVCNYSETQVKGNSTSFMESSHVFNDPVFWQHFQQKVRSQSWKCNFPPEILLQNLEQDAKLYKNDDILRKRRHIALNWIKNDTMWINLILGACKEIASGSLGANSLQLQKVQMFEALADYVEHLNCFQVIASKMKLKGKEVKPFSQDSSQIHDIDKLDPIMIVGYSERFEDNQETSVWDACVNRHTHINPHHQAHCMWTRNCSSDDSLGYCKKDIMKKALLEMVCDKVSRRLQKSLNGVVSDDMWNVDMAFYKGLSQFWLDEAQDLMESMKDHNR